MIVSSDAKCQNKLTLFNLGPSLSVPTKLTYTLKQYPSVQVPMCSPDGLVRACARCLATGLQDDISRAENLASQCSSKANAAEIMAAQALNTANEILAQEDP
eukprot:5552563-Pyramimonas_sp.AAC.1